MWKWMPLTRPTSALTTWSLITQENWHQAVAFAFATDAVQDATLR
jgi:hypothetical protein